MESSGDSDVMRPGSEIPPVAVAAAAMVGYGEYVQDVEADGACDI
jgi:hypothetical protein